ncbi:MAG: hypothetical protein WCA55_03000, partial [Xanthobacteraceae bacterium]
PGISPPAGELAKRIKGFLLRRSAGQNPAAALLYCANDTLFDALACPAGRSAIPFLARVGDPDEGPWSSATVSAHQAISLVITMV